ncbi:hypothetical protein C8Q74DRAFT_747171 [Fomes fomentarius]|nr:hypothetical protein C8Q74DRAFT_747171 [Fomes fomentarius]
MLSALSATQHALQFNDPLACSYDRSSPFLPRSSYLTLPAMQGKPLQTSACSNAGSPKVRPCVTSPHDMFRVFGYTPHEGVAGISIVVNVQFTFLSDETTFLRIVVGNRALSTAVRASASKRGCEWDLEATVPDFETATSTGFPSSTVPLTVQALNSANVTLDSLTFGKFTYTRRYAAPSPLLLCKKENDDFTVGPATASGSPDLSIPGMPSSSHHSALSRRTSRPTSSSGSSRSRIINAPIPSKEPHSVRGQPKKQSLIRARRAGSEDDDPDNNYRAVLAIETPTDSMANVEEWDADERRIGRRLVRFTRVQDGCTLHVVCEAIRPSDYTEGDTVVSCIHRPCDISGSGDAPASQCCITSVDIIFLLECLVGEIFNIEEKNRIRRNLEGFRPKTVSKNKSGTEDFFQKIMDFPTPKPRNIEKDVKVFDWAVLPQALDKIISKYTLYPAIKKQDGSATPPIVESRGSAASAIYSTSSPVPEHASARSSDQPYFYHPQTYSQPQYDPLDNSYMTAPGLSSAGAFDNFLSHSHPPSATPSPTPLLSTPHDSPLVSSSLSLSYPSASEQYLGASQLLYPDQSAFGSTYTSYELDVAEFERHKLSPSSQPHGSHQAFL